MQARRSRAAPTHHRPSATAKQAQPAAAIVAAQPSQSPGPAAPAQQAPRHGSAQQPQQGLQEAAGPSGQTAQEGNKRQSGNGQEGQKPTTWLGKALGVFSSRKAAPTSKQLHMLLQDRLVLQSHSWA